MRRRYACRECARVRRGTPTCVKYGERERPPTHLYEYEYGYYNILYVAMYKGINKV